MLLDVDKGWIAAWNADRDSLVADTKMYFPSPRGKKREYITALMIALQRKHIPVTSQGVLTWIPLAFSSQCHCTRHKRNIHFPFLYLNFYSNCWCGFSSVCVNSSLFTVGISFTSQLACGSKTCGANRERPIPMGITFLAIFSLSFLPPNSVTAHFWAPTVYLLCNTAICMVLGTWELYQSWGLAGLGSHRE